MEASYSNLSKVQIYAIKTYCINYTNSIKVLKQLKDKPLRGRCSGGWRIFEAGQICDALVRETFSCEIQFYFCQSYNIEAAV